MNLRSKSRRILLLMGDIIALYLGLFATLIIRYGNDFYGRFIDLHFLPFTFIFAVWIVIFYIAGLYDIQRLRNNLDFFKIFGLTLSVNAIFAILFFYLIPVFGITPKTNLFIFIAVFATIELYWRHFWNQTLARGAAPNRVLVVGNGNTVGTILKAIAENPQFGYEVKARLPEEELRASPKRLYDLAIETHANIVIVPRKLKHDERLNKALYDLLAQGVEVRDIINFYELLMRRVPVADLEEGWFLDNLINQQKFYDPLKRAWEFLAALLLGIALLPLELIIAILIKITSKGPVIYKQLRIGKNGRHFMLYKFRTMYEFAEKRGPQWADPNDLRATPLGKILRYAHLDELPQLLNIIRNEIAFVGPRPERPEFVEMLKEKIPYYEIRHLIKPGVTGWAQINYRYGASVEDSYEKLQFDIYYLKNRSLFLDVAIILKTLKTFFVNQR
ncbi:MAG: sugar transferase [Candidatus Liptonbacteria bacterium]|nr:sugar transferase [Candidatus Liptonbacteria bacterium]